MFVEQRVAVLGRSLHAHDGPHVAGDADDAPVREVAVTGPDEHRHGGAAAFQLGDPGALYGWKPRGVRGGAADDVDGQVRVRDAAAVLARRLRVKRNAVAVASQLLGGFAPHAPRPVVPPLRRGFKGGRSPP